MIKIFNFSFKNTRPPIDFFLARLFFRRKKTVRKKVVIIYEHLFMCFKKIVCVNKSNMIIQKIELFKLNVPLTEPFVIAIETITDAESVAVKITTDTGIIGFGECNPYRSIAGETQGTCFAAGQFLAKILRGSNPLAIAECMQKMDKMLAGNRCIK